MKCVTSFTGVKLRATSQKNESLEENFALIIEQIPLFFLVDE